jgi:hypothetical protein
MIRCVSESIGRSLLTDFCDGRSLGDDPISAQGHKRHWLVGKPRPLHRRKRTSLDTVVMSALCQKATLEVDKARPLHPRNRQSLSTVFIPL